jgi:hypothetical protein
MEHNIKFETDDSGSSRRHLATLELFKTKLIYQIENRAVQILDFLTLQK